MNFNKLKLILILMLLVQGQLAAQKYYNQWPMGLGEAIDMNAGISLLDFNNGKVSVSGPRPSNNYSIGSNSAYICDEDGDVKLITNGCAILNAYNEVISNGDSLSPGWVYDVYCPNFYPGFHKTLMLPDLEDDRNTLVVYRDGVITKDSELFSDRMYYSQVFTEDQDDHAVTKKSVVMRDTRALYTGISAIPHSNGVDWWIIECRGQNTNEWLTYRLNKDTFHINPPQSIGPTINRREFEASQIIFSPDGRKMVIMHQKAGIVIYDFDRQTGKLSNERNYFREWMINTDTTVLDGSCYSPDSRILYLTNSLDLYQLIEEDLIEPIHHIKKIPRLFDDYSHFPIYLGEMQIGPDCKIYMAPRFVGGAMHVIFNPNEKGKACDLRIKAFNMPSRIFRRIPEKPFYHLATGTPLCDNTIEWLTTSVDDQNEIQSLEIYPNPTSSSGFTIASLFMDDEVEIFNIQGSAIPFTRKDGFILLQHPVKGLFQVRVVSEDGVVRVGKVVVN